MKNPLAEIFGAIADGLANTVGEAVTDIREKVVEQGWFGRVTGAQEIGNDRMSDISQSLHGMGQKVDGIEQSLNGMGSSIVAAQDVTNDRLSTISESLGSIADRMEAPVIEAPVIEPARGASLADRMGHLPQHEMPQELNHEHELER
jgi:hypothetical protein